MEGADQKIYLTQKEVKQMLRNNIALEGYLGDYRVSTYYFKRFYYFMILGPLAMVGLMAWLKSAKLGIGVIAVSFILALYSGIKSVLLLRKLEANGTHRDEEFWTRVLQVRGML